MKKVLCCCSLVFLFCLYAGASFAEGLVKITDHVYTYADAKNPSPANSFGANAGVIIGNKGVVVVDSLASPKEAQKLIMDIGNITDKPIRYLVNTHSHFDHTLGNADLSSMGLAIIAHENAEGNMKAALPRLIRNAAQYGFSEEEAKAIKPAYPNVTFGDRMRIDLGGISVELRYMGTSHTNDSILVFVPEDNIVFAGDILFTNYYPFLGDGDIEGWDKALDYVKNLEPDVIIPGHGPLSTKKDVSDMKDFILAFDKAAREQCAKSDDLQAIAAEVKNAVPARAYADFLILGSIQAKYLKPRN